MVTIRLHNTKTRTKEIFAPIDETNVRMYVCGPTVYDRAHLGNGRPVVVFDILYRLLRHVYGADQVTYARNFTDVDDKINATAQARKAAGDARPLEALIHERTQETIGWYHADMDALGALRPTFEPRATEYIGPMIAMIETLIAGGHAYEKAGHVLFRVRSYTEYGALSGRSVDDMIAGARVEVAPFKEDPMDFVLWKPSDADLPGWPSPWGKGRPGWHIECSAMSYELLGGSFDIHGGGLDLQFPHHENEIAQSACAHPDHEFARVWMHNEMLQVDGKKMSKSLGNFFTVRDLLDQGIPGEVIRMVYLGTHYSKPMDWTEDKATQAAATLQNWYQVLHQHGFGPGLVANLRQAGAWEPDAEFLGAIANDLNTAGAIARLHALSGKTTAITLAPFACGLDMLGLVRDWSDLANLGGDKAAQEPWLETVVAGLLVQRQEARANRDFAEADRIRAVLTAAGVLVTDVGGMASWQPGPDFDPAKLEALK